MKFLVQEAALASVCMALALVVVIGTATLAGYGDKAPTFVAPNPTVKDSLTHRAAVLDAIQALKRDADRLEKLVEAME